MWIWRLWSFLDRLKFLGVWYPKNLNRMFVSVIEFVEWKICNNPSFKKVYLSEKNLSHFLGGMFTLHISLKKLWPHVRGKIVNLVGVKPNFKKNMITHLSFMKIIVDPVFHWIFFQKYWIFFQMKNVTFFEKKLLKTLNENFIF